MNLRTFLTAIRWQNVSIIWMMQVIVFIWYVLPYCGNHSHSLFSFLLLLMVTGAVLAGGNIYNDIQDISADSFHPRKPSLIVHKVTVKVAYRWYLYLNTLAIVLTLIGIWIYEWSMLVVFLIGLALGSLYLYSRFMKSTLLAGNLLIAWLCASAVWITTLLLPQCDLGTTLDLHSKSHVILYGYMINAFLITLLREIVKDKEDAQYDIQANVYTIGSVSESKFRSIVNGLIAVIFGLNWIWFSYLKTVLSTQGLMIGVILIFIPLAFILVIFNRSKKPNLFRFLSQLIKIYVVVALLLLILWQLF